MARSAFQAGESARALGFERNISQLIATAVSELARNIEKYAGEGEIVIREVRRDDRLGIEIIASDRGPGIDDIEQALADQFSSGGTLGLGLPGARRLMDDFEIESAPGEGTRVIVRKWQ